jgi:hypothetical protein
MPLNINYKLKATTQVLTFKLIKAYYLKLPSSPKVKNARAIPPLTHMPSWHSA